MFKNKRGMFLVGLIVVAITLLACDGGEIIALATNPTATSTRTPRPTFTPRPSETPLAVDTPIPAATETPAATAPATKKPAVSSVAVSSKASSVAPPPPAAPSYSVNFLESYTCEQGADVYDVLGRIRSASTRKMLGGFVIAILTPSGQIIPGLTFESVPDEYQFNGLYSNCKVDKWWNHNMKLDASELRGKGSFLVRVIKSKTDPTPLSKDVPVDFKLPIRYIIEYSVP